MRVSTRLLRNATGTYGRLAATFAIGIFTTWYMLGALGVVGFGLIALASSSTSLARSVEMTLRSGLVRELAVAIATRDTRLVQNSFSAAFRLCSRLTSPLLLMTLVLASVAHLGLFNLPEDQPGLRLALVVLIVAEGLHSAVRLLSAPFLQMLFAAQYVGLDNLLQVVARATYALAAVITFGYVTRGAPLQTQLMGFAVSRVTLQLLDVVLGVWIARRLVPGLEFGSDGSRAEYTAIRSTVWHSSQVEMLLNFNPQFLAILINLFFGLTYNSLWQIAVQLSGYARMASDNLLRGIEPLTTHLVTSGHRDTAINLMKQTVRYQLAITLPITVFLAVYVEPMLALWVRARLVADAQLKAAGVSATTALGIAATMVVLLLIARALRSPFYGIERTLYGMGHVQSYSWFAKWCAGLTVGLGAVLMAWSGRPAIAPVALAVPYGLFAVVLLRAAHRHAGLPIFGTLRYSLPGPLLANALLLVFLLAARPFFETLSPVSLLALVIIGTGVYLVLALTLITHRSERLRLFEFVAHGAR